MRIFLGGLLDTFNTLYLQEVPSKREVNDRKNEKSPANSHALASLAQWPNFCNISNPFRTIVKWLLLPPISNPTSLQRQQFFVLYSVHEQLHPNLVALIEHAPGTPPGFFFIAQNKKEFAIRSVTWPFQTHKDSRCFTARQLSEARMNHPVKAPREIRCIRSIGYVLKINVRNWERPAKIRSAFVPIRPAWLGTHSSSRRWSIPWTFHIQVRRCVSWLKVACPRNSYKIVGTVVRRCKNVNKQTRLTNKGFTRQLNDDWDIASVSRLFLPREAVSREKAENGLW